MCSHRVEDGACNQAVAPEASARATGVVQGHTVPVRIRLRHVIHSLVVLAVLTQLALAGLFLADVLTTSATYDGLVAHRVPVTAYQVNCFNAVGEPEKFFYDNCYASYKYQDQTFHAWIDKSWGSVFYVDPLNTSYRMNKATFDSATENIDSDILFIVLLLLGAIAVTAVHQLHMYRRRKRRRLFAHHVHQYQVSLGATPQRVEQL
jgi:hypothetical protein